MPSSAGSVSGNALPMSPRPAAPSRASMMAWVSTSASECPSSPFSQGMSTPPRMSLAPVHQPVDVVAVSDPQIRVCHCSSASPIARSAGVVNLMLESSPSTRVTCLPRCSAAEQSSVSGTPFWMQS